jgi:hypothetical protein
MNDYETDAPGQDVTAAGETLPGSSDPAYTSHAPTPHPNYATYRTRDIWQAAALDCYGITCVGARLLDTGKTEWEFDNEGDNAWKTGQEFRTGWLSATLRDFRSSYRKMMDIATVARREGFYQNDNAA